MWCWDVFNEKASGWSGETKRRWQILASYCPSGITDLGIVFYLISLHCDVLFSIAETKTLANLGIILSIRDNWWCLRNGWSARININAETEGKMLIYTEYPIQLEMDPSQKYAVWVSSGEWLGGKLFPLLCVYFLFCCWPTLNEAD